MFGDILLAAPPWILGILVPKPRSASKCPAIIDCMRHVLFAFADLVHWISSTGSDFRCELSLGGPGPDLGGPRAPGLESLGARALGERALFLVWRHMDGQHSFEIRPKFAYVLSTW